MTIYVRYLNGIIGTDVEYAREVIVPETRRNPPGDPVRAGTMLHRCLDQLLQSIHRTRLATVFATVAAWVSGPAGDEPRLFLFESRNCFPWLISLEKPWSVPEVSHRRRGADRDVVLIPPGTDADLEDLATDPCPDELALQGALAAWIEAALAHSDGPIACSAIGVCTGRHGRSIRPDAV